MIAICGFTLILDVFLVSQEEIFVGRCFSINKQPNLRALLLEHNMNTRDMLETFVGCSEKRNSSFDFKLSLARQE